MAGNFPAPVQGINVSLSPDNSPTNPVSWQTAFLGLIPLALNAMTQPSSLDLNLPESSLLFAARSSPFICVADALEVIIALCLYTHQEGNIHEAARIVNWRIARARLGSGVSELEASVVEKHPRTFLILFLVTLLQAIKFLGLQGLPWTKVWAGIYLCSYVVLAIVRALASKDWRDRPPRVSPLAENALFKENLLGIIRIVLLVVANVVHASVSCWALSHMQYQYIGIFEVSSGGVYEGTSRRMIPIFQMIFFSYMTLALPILLPFVLYFRYTEISVREQRFNDFNELHNPSRPRWKITSTIDFVLFFITKTVLNFWITVAVAVVLYAYIIYYLMQAFSFSSLTISMIIVTGSSTLALCFGLLFLLFTIMSAISKRVRFLSFLKFDDGDYKALLAFPFFNFLVALLYYRYVYDPTGTVKPSWTENLG